jgi:nucleoside-diphosphate-sugar epimerase
MDLNILIAGATGKTGLHLVQHLIEKGHTPTALVREGSDTSKLPAGTNLRKGDLTNLQADVCDGMDVVVFAAGSGGSTGPEMTDKVDRDGAKRLIDLSRETGIKRFVCSARSAQSSRPPQATWPTISRQSTRPMNI